VDPGELARAYVLLALRCDRVLPGLVDSYTGPPGQRQQVAGESSPQPADLAATAARLRGALADTPMDEARRDFLDGQLGAVHGLMRRAAGIRVSYRAELRTYFGVTAARSNPDVLRQAHARLAEVLPGGGPLAARMEAHRGREEVPAELRGPVLRALSEELRALTRRELPLPGGEGVDYESAGDQPWSGLNRDLGGFRSRVVVNTETTRRFSELVRLVAHEAYPGHHVERCRARTELVDRRGWPEHSVFLVNTPRCVLSEGLAEVGLVAAAGPDWVRWAAGLLGPLGVRVDVELVSRVEEAFAVLRGVRQDAALMLHQSRASTDETVAYLRRWLLVGDRRARQMLRFPKHPMWRAYTTTYVEGARLVSAWLDARPPGQPALRRFGRLLDEPLTPAALRAELSAAGPTGAGTANGGPYDTEVNGG
jgi:hypothetical protein